MVHKAPPTSKKESKTYSEKLVLNKPQIKLGLNLPHKAGLELMQKFEQPKSKSGLFLTSNARGQKISELHVDSQQ